MHASRLLRLLFLGSVSLLPLAAHCLAEDWPQLKFDARRSGNVPQRQVRTPLGLLAAIPLTDAVLASPVCVDGKVYVIDGSGVAFCIDTESFEVLWRTATPGGEVNCNNISSPAVAGKYLHFGTTAGSYFVLDRDDGSVVREIACGEPIFSAGSRSRPCLFRDPRLENLFLETRRHPLLDLGLRPRGDELRR